MNLKHLYKAWVEITRRYDQTNTKAGLHVLDAQKLAKWARARSHRERAAIRWLEAERATSR